MARKTAAEKRAESEAIEAREIHEALRWTGPASPDVMPPAGGQSGHSTGWEMRQWALDAPIVERAWSTSISHGSGPAPNPDYSKRIASQNSRPLYSSKVRALQDARHRVEVIAARRLRDIDKQIEAAMKETTHG